MDKIRILYTIPNFITAGSGRAMLNVILQLDRKRYEPSICVSRLGGPLCDEIRQLGIPLIEARFTDEARPWYNLPFRLWKCAREFRKYRFDIWHSYHYRDDYTEPLIARMAGAKAWIYTKKNMNWRRRSWYLRTLFATRVACQNTTMLRDFFSRPGSFKAKTSLVAPGVDHTLFQPATEPRLKLREQLGVAPGVPVVGLVAHLVPVKGHPMLIRAVAEVPGVHLWLAGARHDEEYCQSLEALVKELGITERVSFLGPISDVAAVLAEIDIFVLSTLPRGEGCPAALQEAMSAGVACIASNVSGCNDLITSGVNGLLVPSEDPRSLAEALRTLSDSKEMRVSFAKAARARILSNYTLQIEAGKYDALYQSALGGRSE